jgi:hypothetical protein
MIGAGMIVAGMIVAGMIVACNGALRDSAGTLVFMTGVNR